MKERKENISKSLDLWSSFLSRLERMELLSSEEVKEYHGLMEDVDVNKPADREAKIARFRASKEAKGELERLTAIHERRKRCGVADDEELDGHDEESVLRTIAIQALSIDANEALENWSQSKRELPMIDMMVKMEEERQSMDRHQGSSQAQDRRSQPLSGKPLQVTRITKDSAGQLQVKREEIRSKVFRPGWNQPTMTLEELGEIEYKQAMEREERQKQAESERSLQPRRYEDLVRDGMEDNADLVDASAKLDRDWDDWKDENPRGSGNKMANRGDKNF